MTKLLKTSLLSLFTAISVIGAIPTSVKAKLEDDTKKTTYYKKFTGTIGNKYKIKMTLSRDGNNIIGFYQYENVKKSLKLKGTVDSINNVEIKEFDSNGNQTGLFKYNILDESKIEGGWSKPDGSKSMTVRLEEVKDSELKTQILDAATKKALMGKHNCSLQWISWTNFGKINVTENDGTVFVTGKQEDKAKGNYLTINGRFVSIDKDELVFFGEIITKVDHIASGKPCKKQGILSFQKTDGRAFWRLQEMKNECDIVTDYVDISL